MHEQFLLILIIKSSLNIFNLNVRAALGLWKMLLILLTPWAHFLLPARPETAIRRRREGQTTVDAACKRSQKDDEAFSLKGIIRTVQM